MPPSKVSYQLPLLEEHVISSSHVAQRFKVHVLQPLRRADGSERFPVLYATDADTFFDGLANIAKVLQLTGEAPRFLLVGIGYENARAADVLRMRDLFTHGDRLHFREVINQLAAAPLVAGVDDLRVVTNSSDAHDFLRFISDELMPFVDARYPVVPGDNSYSGYSAGGTFGLFTLLTAPATFRRYIVGSPATSYDGHQFGNAMVEAFTRTQRSLSAKVFMSVGELEEFLGKFDLTSGFCVMAKSLKNAGIPGLDLHLQVFLGETHATAWLPAFVHGVKALFGPADGVPWWPQFG